MKKLVAIPPESLDRLKKDDFKDFGHQFVSIKLKDGRVFPQAVASEGCVIQVKRFREVPFVETDIESVARFPGLTRLVPISDEHSRKRLAGKMLLQEPRRAGFEAGFSGLHCPSPRRHRTLPPWSTRVCPL